MISRLGRSPLFRALSPQTLRALVGRAVARSFSKGQLLLGAGERAEWFHVLEEGLVREYYVTSEGAEHTRAFVAEGGVTGSLLDLTSGLPSVTWIQALEPTRTIAIRMVDLDGLVPTHPELESLARRHAEALAVRKTMREYEMLALSAEERLARWRVEQPGLDGRVTRRLLASYLGITPVHLSRISSSGGAGVSGGRRGKGPRPR